MNKLPSRALALALLLSAPLASLLAQPPDPNSPAVAHSPAAKAKFRLSWEEGSLPLLDEAKSLLSAMLKEVKQGTRAPNDPALDEVRARIEHLTKEIPVFAHLDFPGGTLSSFLAEFKSLPGEMSFNVIDAGDPADLETELPRFSLHHVTLTTVATVLSQVLDTRGLILRVDSTSANSVLCILSRSGAPGNTPPKSAFTSFQLADVLSGKSLTVDDLVDTIRAAWGLDPQHVQDTLHLKFHAPTQLLLVSGPDESIRICTNVIDSLRRHSPPNFDSNPVAKVSDLPDSDPRKAAIAEELARRRATRESGHSPPPPAPATPPDKP
jgi:hypothetical protein